MPLIESAISSQNMSIAMGLLALMSILNGCTQAMWQNVPPDRTNYSRITGVTEPNATGRRQLLLSFSTHNAPPTTRVIQLDELGLAPEPFRYTGKFRDADQILADIGNRRIDFIATYQLEPADAGRRKPLPAHVEDVTEDSPFQERYYQRTPSGGVVVVAYRIDAQGHLHTPFRVAGQQWRVVEPGFNVMVIPQTQSRTTGQILAERWVPVVLTPFTVAGDTVLVPGIFFGYMLTAGMTEAEFKPTNVP